MNKNNKFVEELDCDEFEEECMIDGDYDEKLFGKAVASFNFGERLLPADAPLILPEQPEKTDKCIKTMVIDSRKGKPCANGITPPIDGESFEISRTYKLRRSTVKMLNELKGSNSNINIYLNTIIDNAIRHYYDHVIHKGGA